MIAELCAASQDCRFQLARRRDRQRKQSFWLCKLVEIGWPTNSVVDWFLKIRAGENILSLLSAMTPFMSKTLCNATVLPIIERLGARLDRTPEVRQLNNVYDAAVILALQMGIKRKVLFIKKHHDPRN